MRAPSAFVVWVNAAAVALAGPAAAQEKYDPGASGAEIKIGPSSSKALGTAANTAIQKYLTTRATQGGLNG